MTPPARQPGDLRREGPGGVTRPDATPPTRRLVEPERGGDPSSPTSRPGRVNTPAGRPVELERRDGKTIVRTPGTAGAPGGAGSALTTTGTTPGRAEYERLHALREKAISNGTLNTLKPIYDNLPVAPGTPATLVPLNGAAAIGGVGISASYFDAGFSSASSSFFFSLSIGGGGWCDPWWQPSCFTWGNGWRPYCGGWNTCFSWGRPFCRPWFRPVWWSDPWCAPTCWPVAWQPAWSTCFGWSAFSSTWVFGTSFVPAPPPVVVISEPVAPVYVAPALPSPSQAWSWLLNGYDQAALADFARLAQANPQDAEALLGYALANSLLGFDASASVAMRQALALDASRLSTVPLDAALATRLQNLVARNKDLARGSGPAALDAQMMVAALQAILGDNANAYFAADTAIQRGLGDPAILNLREFLRVQLTNAP